MGILITDQLTQLSTESEVLNEVAKNPGIIRKYLQDLTPSLLGFLVQLMIAVIILLVGSRMIKMLVKMVRRFLERGKVEAGVVSFLSSFVKYALYFVLAMIILGQFGVTTSSVIAVLGSAGLNEIKKGRQVYIVYPLIKESEKMDYKDLEDGYADITQAFPPPEYVTVVGRGLYFR